MIVGGLAAGMAYWTLRNIEHQTEQLKVQADLMREQMNRAVARERARLSIEVQPLQIDDSFPGAAEQVCSCIEITNIGHSNAYVRFGAVRFIMTEAGEWPLPQPDPDEFGGLSAIPPSESPHYIGLYAEIDPDTIPAFLEKLADATLRFCLYGFIEYESMGIQWHRDFGYIWIVEDHIRASVAYRLPKDGKLYPSGRWEQDIRQKNGEYEQKAN